ncbi:MAG: sigma-54-dependent Fis family transcriptional regulator [Stenotrophomonas nitritireducens]|uniref:sigma-54-dependent transcriptional regulator n=1 Tax=Stenotrophomonas nitritireducens TaxID=83617 RepID=UPI001ACA57C9|nr:sigma-54 dependent transcriptional regulator [Stenotrophomonas nitritireducens]MBN8768986.1 sigma-54-dependent Fis family transcriptional regulator [Stenotrophomonas sp.]MBN8793024.1 sigma-54-dependent Fis family transcriptional regulator [Stenotrophomonas nitritireducens]
MTAPTLAIVDDDPDFSVFLTRVARSAGFLTHQFHTVSEASFWLSSNEVDLTILDMALPDGTGLDILGRIPADRHGQIVFVSGTSDTEQIRRAVASPATEFIGKPVGTIALEQLFRRVQEDLQCRRHGKDDAGLDLVGESAPMRRVKHDILRVAPTDMNVLVLGETGTGKELVARAVHAHSGRSGKLICMNCGAVPAELMASQLFGHERGAFTGAANRHAGFLEQADGGTLFLDEIGEMPAALQVYLLRVLETGTVVRVGGTGEIPVDVRVVAATNRLPDEGMLRDDLFYRLGHYLIELPPLRARGDDIRLLASRFVALLNDKYGGPPKRLDPAGIARLLRHAWPGNVRELMAATERAYLNASGPMVDINPLALARRAPDGGDVVQFSIGTPLQDIEEEMLKRTLAFHGGDKTATARSLGVSVRTVHNHLARTRLHG